MGGMPGSCHPSSSGRPCPGSWPKADRPLLPLAGSIQPLSSQSLRASSSAGTDPHHLLYRVVQGPRLGRLFRAQQGSTGEALVNFTQAEVRAQLSTAPAQTPSSLRWHTLPMDTSTNVGSRHSLGLPCSRPCMPCLPGATRLVGQKGLSVTRGGRRMQEPRAGIGSWGLASRRKLQQDPRGWKGCTV